MVLAGGELGWGSFMLAIPSQNRARDLWVVREGGGGWERGGCREGAEWWVTTGHRLNLQPGQHPCSSSRQEPGPAHHLENNPHPTEIQHASSQLLYLKYPQRLSICPCFCSSALRERIISLLLIWEFKARPAFPVELDLKQSVVFSCE